MHWSFPLRICLMVVKLNCFLSSGDFYVFFFFFFFFFLKTIFYFHFAPSPSGLTPAPHACGGGSDVIFKQHRMHLFHPGM